MGRPLSGVSAPKNRRMSLIDRVSMANTGAPYEAPAPVEKPLTRQLEAVQESAPEKNNEVKPAVGAVAKPAAKKTTKKVAADKPVKKPAPVSESDEIAAHKKKMEDERREKDIKAYAIKKAQQSAAAKLAAKKK